MYKVFINDTVFWLGFNLEKSFFNKEISFTTCCSFNDFKEIIKANENSEEVIVNFLTERTMKKILQKRYRIVEAGGGIVINKKGEVLFIHRRGKWDLPKGKLEKHEKVKDGAVREVEEECGISGPIIREELITTFHKFKSKKRECLKKTYWFIMDYDGDEELIPQLEEDITKAKWMGEEKFNKVKSNTFTSISDVLDAYLKTKKQP
jgi:ADP-ribose pyrophosphatase YjhB (NUDIX family)